ncbi:hypothetical protein JCM8097_007782 [Rhodosporidiobolus ruineniae]
MPRASTSSAAPRPARSLASRLARSVVSAALAVTLLGATAAAQAPFEPAGSQVLFGMWFDSSTEYGDSPSAINQKLGFNVPVFQMAQVIPRLPFNYVTGSGGPAPENTIEESETDAAVFLTVYPTTGFNNVTTDDFTILAQQILVYQTTYNRTVFLRYAPEMQGTWMAYGQEPTQFLASWKEMYTTVKATAPDTIMVWAPNTGQGYPYGQTSQFAAASAADQALLDTNGDREFNYLDDPYSPYWPGEEYVDWIGLSIYYKGIPSDARNTLQADGYCHNVMNGWDPSANRNMTSWYTEYCEKYPTKACMFAEAGAAFHEDDGGVSEEAIQQAWLKDCVVNTTMYEIHPRLKMYMHFEYEKEETSNDLTPQGDYDDMRDYRLTNNSVVLAELVSDLSAAGTLFTWAQSRALPTSVSSAGAPAPKTDSAGSTIQNAITATTRAKPTGFPSLFGTSGASQAAEWAELGILVAAGAMGAWTVMRTL